MVSHLVLHPGSTLFCHKRMVYKFMKHPKYFDMYYNKKFCAGLIWVFLAIINDVHIHRICVK